MPARTQNALLARRRGDDAADVIRAKIARLATGAKPRVLDLFSGCGGMSLGFHSAGFEIAAAIEQDRDAAMSHGLNFHRGSAPHCQARDITKTSPDQLAESLSLGASSTAFDVIIGGPPCQAFARVGRSKLREVAEHPEAFRHDPRARLYIEYIEYVKKCMPLAVVMENVPDMMNFAGHNVAEEVAELLTDRGYVVGYTLLNAVFYGVPQMRERMVLIALRSEISPTITFPVATHWLSLPAGYEGTRAVALKLISAARFIKEKSHYIPTPEAKPCLAPAITAKQALEDLPSIDARAMFACGALKRGARRFTDLVPHQVEARAGSYAAMMRQWDGFAATGVKDHVIRYLPRDYQLFARMDAGDQYPEAHEHARTMFRERLAAIERETGEKLTSSQWRWRTERKKIVPPYDPGKFPNKWRKMEPDSPARTLMAHLGKDSYSHIHYDSNQARTISVREAARLQSFPDGFVFAGTMNPAFKQIGNAVPPLLAKAVAISVMRQLKARCDTEQLAAS